METPEVTRLDDGKISVWVIEGDVNFSFHMRTDPAFSLAMSILKQLPSVYLDAARDTMRHE